MARISAMRLQGILAVVMSELSVRYLSALNGSADKLEVHERQDQMKAVAENGNNNDLEQKMKSSISLASKTVIENGCVKPGTDFGNAEIKNLNDLDDVGTALKGLLSGLESKDSVLLCETLSNARRLSLFHKETMVSLLEEMITLLVKSLKNPRSAVCKTALMTSANLFSAYNDQLIDFLDPLLVQILVKASQDKKFVCEAAERVLAAMTAGVYD